MIELKYTFSSSAELLAHLTALGTPPTLAATVAKAEKGNKPTASIKADTPALTATQTAAVDDTAGVGNVNNPPAKGASTEPTASAAAGGAQGTKGASSEKAVAYPELQAATFKLAAAAGKEDTLALIATFGVKSFKELDPSKYGEALTAVQKKLGELETVA